MSWWKCFFGIESPATQSGNRFDNPEEYGLPPLSELDDPLYYDALQFVLSSRSASVSALQRQLKIGYNRACRLIESMERDGTVSAMDANGARKVLVAGFDVASMVQLRKNAREAEEQERARRLSYLIEKYQDEETVRRIMEQTVWEGMTSAQLFDALGKPEAVDQKYLKKASREVWKYLPMGTNRYAAKITLENGLVVGWDFKE